MGVEAAHIRALMLLYLTEFNWSKLPYNLLSWYNTNSKAIFPSSPFLFQEVGALTRSFRTWRDFVWKSGRSLRVEKSLRKVMSFCSFQSHTAQTQNAEATSAECTRVLRTLHGPQRVRRSTTIPDTHTLSNIATLLSLHSCTTPRWSVSCFSHTVFAECLAPLFRIQELLR